MKASDRYMLFLSNALPEETPQRDRFLKDMELSLEEKNVGNSRTSFLSLCKRFGTPSKAAEEYLVGMGADDLAYRVRSSRYRHCRKIVFVAISAALVIFLIFVIVKSVSSDAGYIISDINYH